MITLCEKVMKRGSSSGKQPKNLPPQKSCISSASKVPSFLTHAFLPHSVGACLYMA